MTREHQGAVTGDPVRGLLAPAAPASPTGDATATKCKPWCGTKGYDGWGATNMSGVRFQYCCEACRDAGYSLRPATAPEAPHREAPRMFPVLVGLGDRDRNPPCPRQVPWEWLAPHEKQAKENHDQNLETLASRGGLDPLEMWCVLHDRKWPWGVARERRARMMNTAVLYLQERLERYTGGTRRGP